LFLWLEPESVKWQKQFKNEQATVLPGYLEHNKEKEKGYCKQLPYLVIAAEEKLL